MKRVSHLGPRPSFQLLSQNSDGEMKALTCAPHRPQLENGCLPGSTRTCLKWGLRWDFVAAARFTLQLQLMINWCKVLELTTFGVRSSSSPPELLSSLFAYTCSQLPVCPPTQLTPTSPSIIPGTAHTPPHSELTLIFQSHWQARLIKLLMGGVRCEGKRMRSISKIEGHVWRCTTSTLNVKYYCRCYGFVLAGLLLLLVWFGELASPIMCGSGRNFEPIWSKIFPLVFLSKLFSPILHSHKHQGFLKLLTIVSLLLIPSLFYCLFPTFTPPRPLSVSKAPFYCASAWIITMVCVCVRGWVGCHDNKKKRKWVMDQSSLDYGESEKRGRLKRTDRSQWCMEVLRSCSSVTPVKQVSFLLWWHSSLYPRNLWL